MFYLIGIYLESWFSWSGGGLQKKVKKRREWTKEKHWRERTKRKKNEEYWESQITKINIFGFNFYIKNYILLTFYLQFLFVAGYLKRSNDTPKFLWICISVETPWSLTKNIHKWTKYYNADFYNDQLLDTDVREVPSF